MPIAKLKFVFFRISFLVASSALPTIKSKWWCNNALAEMNLDALKEHFA